MNRVQLAAMELDQRKPGWANRISLRRLDMLDMNDCILGQVYGSYLLAPDELTAPVRKIRSIRKFRIVISFCPFGGNGGKTYRRWDKEVRLRQDDRLFVPREWELEKKKLPIFK